MRLAVPTFDKTKQIVRDYLEKARTADSISEAAHYQRLARNASEG